MLLLFKKGSVYANLVMSVKPLMYNMPISLARRIADMAIWPWCYCVRNFYGMGEHFEEFKNVQRWYDSIDARPAVKRGVTVTPFSR